MILEAFLAVAAGFVGGMLGGYFVASYRRRQQPEMTARAKHLDALLAQAIESRDSLDTLQLQVLIHIYDALERIATGGRKP